MPRKNLTEHLERFGSQLIPNSSTKSQSKIPNRYNLLANSVKGELITAHGACYCLVKTLYPIGYPHGANVLSAVSPADTVSTAAFSVQDEISQLPFGSMLFLDTETTGLGGSGAVAFLVGVGRIVKEGFEVSQYLIPDYSDEAAMLEDLNQLINKASTIVSFNGASFDLPLLQDRFIINRVARKIECGCHLDLLHPARRLYKRRLKDCTLTNLERQLMLFHRRDDIPGYLVPSVYFDWLSAQDLTMMNSVLEHNRLDIVSLYFLMRLIAETYLSTGENLEHVDDLHSLSRILERRRETEKIEYVFERVEEIDSNVTPDAALHFARAFKRTAQFERSVTLWKSISENDNMESYRACEELAKYYEHREKDFVAALNYAEKAVRCDLISDRQIKLTKFRIDRISRKLKSRDG